MIDDTRPGIGFAPDEIDPSVTTRSARLKWVVVVDEALPAGRAANAALCVGAATTAAVAGLLGPPVQDASGSEHPGLPWAGCTVLAADRDTLRVIRTRADARHDVFVAGMPAEAQETRVYAEYLDSVAASPSDRIEYLAVSLVGPRNPVDKIVGRLPLLT